MKIEEAYLQIVEKELEENLLRNTLAAATLAGAAIGAYHNIQSTPDASSNINKVTKSVTGKVQSIQQALPTQLGTKKLTTQQDASKSSNQEEPLKDLSRDELLSNVVDRFKIHPKKAAKIVDAAIRHQKPEFPRAHHILAIIGIESSFNDRAKSKLKFDPAVGLMQIRPKIWNINKKELSTIDGQIKHGAQILHTYFKKTGDDESAIKSYNIGLTNFNKGIQKDAAHRYISKFNRELDSYYSDTD
jgi:hypothetical protein